MAAPPSQTFREMSFLLSGGQGGDLHFTFGIRPEELSRDEPQRLAVQQTLGGAWADLFGPGVKTISLSGHNGWRGGLLLSGEDMFIALRDTVIGQYNSRRAALIQQNQDPSAVTLTFTDTLNNISAFVTPQSFRLLRSRSRPLLMMYSLTLLELAPVTTPASILDQIMQALTDPTRWLLGYTGLTGEVLAIQGYVQQAQNVLGTIAGAVGMFSNVATSLFASVATTAQSVQGQFDSSVSILLTLGSSVAQAGRNAFYALAGDPTLPQADLIPIMNLSSSFNNAACAMASFNAESTFTTLDPLLGASACSSTAGGDPINVFTAAGANPFESLFGASEPPVLATAAVTQAITYLMGDPIELVGSTAAIGAALEAIATGITLPT